MSYVVSEADVLFDLEYPSYVYGPPLFTFDVPLHTSFHLDAFIDHRLRENNLDLIVCYYMGIAQKIQNQSVTRRSVQAKPESKA